jgi:hypothetical protein
VIILNSDLRLKFSDPTLANKVYKTYLKKYTGSLMENPININITKLINPDGYKEMEKQINEKIDSLLEELNKIVLDIYGLENDYKLISDLLQES